MDITLTRADVVILATAHSPGTLSPAWIRANELIVEEARQFLHTPDLTLYEGDTCSLTVDKERLQIGAKKQNEDGINAIRDFCAKYVTLFPNLSYRAFGVNFSWRLTPREGESVPQVSLSIGSVNGLASVFPDHELSYGGIIYATKEPYRLRLMIQPEEGTSLTYLFNYHHDISQLGTEQIVEQMDTVNSLHQHSATIVEKTSTVGGA